MRDANFTVASIHGVGFSGGCSAEETACPTSKEVNSGWENLATSDCFTYFLRKFMENSNLPRILVGNQPLLKCWMFNKAPAIEREAVPLELRICHRRSVMPSCSSRPVSYMWNWRLHWMFNCMILYVVCWRFICISWFHLPIVFFLIYRWCTDDLTSFPDMLGGFHKSTNHP